MAYLSNAFSLQMLDLSKGATIKVTPIDRPDNLKALNSVVGHKDTANVLGVAFNRVSLKLEKGDVLVVAQLTGGRLPEGATTLPEGFKFTFVKVEIL